MNQIRDYVDVMFKALPQNEDINKIKEQIYESMMDKYEDYISNGNTESQSIGMVIGEFGSLDELMLEFGVEDNTQYYNFSRLKKYMAFNKVFGTMIALGVLIATLSVSATVLISQSGNDVLTLCALLFGALIAVAIFVNYGLQNKDYKDMRSGEFVLSSEETTWMMEQKNEVQRNFVIQLILGIGISIIGIILGSIDSLGSYKQGAAFLACAGFGAFFIIRGSVGYSIFNHILDGDYTANYELVSNSKTTWLNVLPALAVFIYIFLGMMDSNLWKSAWVIIPIAGILTGIGNSNKTN